MRFSVKEICNKINGIGYELIQLLIHLQNIEKTINIPYALNNIRFEK